MSPARSTLLPRERSFLGFSIGKGGSIQISEKAIKRFKERIREITSRTRGRSLRQLIAELRLYLLGWRAYFRVATGRTRLRELSAWIQRRLRSCQWKQWDSRGYRELRRRGVSRKLAWNTSKSAHGAWRLSMSPALAIALPTQYFVKLGLPLVHMRFANRIAGHVTRTPGGVGGVAPRGAPLSRFA